MTPCQHKQKNGGSRGNLIFVYHFDLFISNHIILNLNIIRRFGTNMLNFVIIFNFCSSIVCMLFPSTCNLTKSYSPSWKKKKMNSAVWPWCLGERYNYPCTARVTASYKHLRVVCVCVCAWFCLCLRVYIIAKLRKKERCPTPTLHNNS